MNIKRAFFVIASAMLLPGYALAQQFAPTYVDTTISVSNGETVTANAAIVCNSGNPLTQDQDISSDSGVIFTVQELNTGDTSIYCTVSLSGLLPDGYAVVGVVQNEDDFDESSCVFGGPDYLTPFYGPGEVNSCEFLVEPGMVTYTMNKVWEFDDEEQPDISMHFDVEYTCTGACEAADDTDCGEMSGTWDESDGLDYEVSFYPDADGGASCSATETVADSAVESDQGCSSATTFEIGDSDKECTITNTVFFEGIPTLSQYGLAIMALLMLGVGFVGFRRFV